MPKYVHLLGKDARRRVVERLAASRGVRKLAAELGVTPAAISKYLRGETHPSDRVIERALESASPEEALEVSHIVAEELLGGIKDYIEWASEKGVLDPKLATRLSELAAKAGLASMSSRHVEAEEAISSQGA